jgi:large subunit ribosomal protein L32
MAVPAKKKSIFKKHQRHSAWQTLNVKRLANEIALGKCSSCGAVKLSHRVCEKCGYYNGKQVLTIKTKSASKVLEA